MALKSGIHFFIKVHSVLKHFLCFFKELWIIKTLLSIFKIVLIYKTIKQEDLIMVYGIVSQLDDATTKAFFRSKKVADANVVFSTQLSVLVKVLKSGDIVYVVSVNRFGTVSQFLNFGRFCMANGVSLHVLAQPYLDLVSGKHWKPAVMSQMMKMVEIERRATGKMSQGFRMTNEQWEYVYRCFEIMNLEVLAYTFSADGVLKRGS